MERIGRWSDHVRSITTAVLFCVVSFVLSAQQNTTTTLTTSPNPANPSDIINFTITVTPASATGSMTITIGGSAVMTWLGMTDNTTTFQIGLPVGTYAIQAIYGGDQNDNPSKSAVLTQVVTTQPVPIINSINNAASASDGWPASGAAASIFGTFPGVATSAAAGVPLPYSLGGVNVFVDGVRAPLYYVSSSQINFQVPWEVVDQMATISVTNGVWNVTLGTSVLSSWPGLFSPILHGADYSLVTSENPAVDGEVVLLYGTGLGPVSNTPVDGTEASDAPLSPTQNAPKYRLAGKRRRCCGPG